MTKQQKEMQDLIYRLSEISERLEYRQTRPLIRLNPKHAITFLIVLDLVIQGLILYKVY